MPVLSILRRAAAPALAAYTRRAFTAVAAASLLTACGGEDRVPNIPSNPLVETYASATGVVMANMTKINDHLYYQDLTVGTGAQVQNGQTADIRYTGWLINGTIFDSNTGAGRALISPKIGAGEVIPGWDQGIVGMKVGGKRKLVIGSQLAYQNQSPDPRVIPQNATLVFDVTLIAVR